MKSIFLLSILFPIIASAQWVPAEWPVLKQYDNDHLYRIALPLGGIGTGTISLGGRGELRDWEIMNKPAKGFSTTPTGNDAPFFSIWVKPQGKQSVTAALSGSLVDAEYLNYAGRPANHHGMPHFEHASFSTAYPFGQVYLSSENIPVRVRIKGFNPLIPADADASGIPIMILSYEVENPGNQPMEVAVCGSFHNFIGQDGSRFYLHRGITVMPTGAKKNKNEYRKERDFNGIYMYSEGVNTQDPAWGTIALTTDATEGISYRTSSVHNAWGDKSILDFWDDFSADGVMTEKERQYDNNPMASLSVKKSIAPHSKEVFNFYVTWTFPNRLGWVDMTTTNYDKTIFGNYYCTKYTDAWDVVKKTLPELPELERKTISFVNALVKSDCPETIKEAGLFNLSVLRSQTSFRLPSGHFMGWEGITDQAGACEGTCTHVWNYEQATAFLFGDLARTMRDAEFNYATTESGAMNFRIHLPLEIAHKSWNKVAADGQLGCVMKFYREWQLSGDNSFLSDNWPQVKKVMAFAWQQNGWDRDGDGVPETSQHNTMDVDYHGPNPQIGIWYLGALKACSRMAAFMKDKAFQVQCDRLYTKGSAWIDAHLFNGEYYEHQIWDPATGKPVDLNDPQASVPEFQVGKGCLVDQMVGQYMAHICGLGYLVDKDKARITMQSIMKYNYLDDFSMQFNNMRSYVIGNEAGLIMAGWPNGRLKQPFPYFGESMTGFEYTAAVGMLYEGMEKEGLQCIGAIRQRFDGSKRNPFSEPELGHHYARSMASWAAIIAWSGFHYSGVDRSMSFTSRPGTYFWSNGYAWGTCSVDAGSATLRVLHGIITLDTFELKGVGKRKINHVTIKEGESKKIIFAV